MRQTAFVIEKGIPIPPPAEPDRRGPRPRWPFPRMAAGDSFFFPARDRRDAERAALCAARRAGAGIVTRRQPDGIRVWRIR